MKPISCREEAKVAGWKQRVCVSVQSGRTEMDPQQNAGLGARHLSQIKEESESREHSTCFQPWITQRRHTGGVGSVMDEVETLEVTLNDQQREADDNRSLLEELGRIEADLREALRLDMERQQETAFLQQQENMMLRQNLCYLSLSQRVAKPWVSSYFRTFPMHIYCLPVQAAGHQRRRRGLKKRK